MLTNSEGVCTSGVHGFLHRTIKMLELGIRPIFVFDGHPPAMKYDCLKERRVQATKYKKTASSPAETSMPASEAPSRSVPMEIDIDRRLKRLVVHPPLLTHRASTLIAAPQAEATCVRLCKEGKADAVSTEDIDAVVFGAPIVLKNLSNTLHHSRSMEVPNNYVREISRDVVLDSLSLTAEGLAELAILCGCDYCPSIPKIGPTRAYGLLLKHGSITSIITAIEGSKTYKAPSGWAYREARELFLNPLTTDEIFPRSKMNVDALADLLVHRLDYNPARVDNIKNRLDRIGGTATQTAE
ncbi:flap endonuclease-1, putative, partial [Perkinsus marinus ATCC 50983]